MAFLKKKKKECTNDSEGHYKTFVRPTLEYASSTRAPYTERDNHKWDGSAPGSQICNEGLQAHQQCHLHDAPTWLGCPTTA